MDYSYIYVTGMVLTDTEITPSSHNFKQLKNAFGQFPMKCIHIKFRLQHLFFVSSLLSFTSVKSALTILSAI